MIASADCKGPLDRIRLIALLMKAFFFLFPVFLISKELTSPMPVFRKNIFDDYASRFINKHINPYVDILVKNQEHQTLPVFYGPVLQNQAGQWLKHFQAQQTPTRELVLEIGSHNGSTLKQLAEHNPATAFVGIDVTFKRVIRAAQKIHQTGHKNAALVLGDARFVDKLFHQKELDGIIAFFPDPWAKKQKQAHNRLFNLEYCKTLHSLLKPGGFIWLKTDCRDYFESFCEHMRMVQMSRGLAPRSSVTSCDYSSSYGSKFQDLRQDIFVGQWVKPDMAGVAP